MSQNDFWVFKLRFCDNDRTCFIDVSCPSTYFSYNTQILRVIYANIHCGRKKETKMFSVISPIKHWQLQWNLAYSFLNKFAAMWYKRFPPHLNIVSTLPCETWNAHRARATIALLDRENPKVIPPKLWSLNLPDLNSFDNSVWKILQEGVQHMHHWSGAIVDAADGWLPQWWRDPACSTPFSVVCFSSSRSVMRIFYIFSCDISHTL